MSGTQNVPWLGGRVDADLRHRVGSIIALHVNTAGIGAIVERKLEGQRISLGALVAEERDRKGIQPV